MRLTARYPDVVRAVHHPTNYGYGAALRSGFGASRYELIAFTDGDRQFKVVDLGRLTARLAGADHPDVVVGFRIKRADPLVRTLYARAYRLANRHLLRAQGHRRRLRRQAVPARGARGHPRRVGRGVLLGRAAHQAAGGGPNASSRSVSRTTHGRPGSATGAKPSVILRAVRDFWRLRLNAWVNRRRAFRRGGAILGTERGRSSAGRLSRSDSRRPDRCRASSRSRGTCPAAGRPRRR